jgi:hypothetical protein
MVVRYSGQAVHLSIYFLLVVLGSQFDLLYVGVVSSDICASSVELLLTDSIRSTIELVTRFDHLAKSTFALYRG